MELLHAMANHNNAVEPAGCVFWYVFAVALTHCLTQWISAEAAAGQSEEWSWAVGPESPPPLPLPTPSALRNPQGMSAVRENRPGERKQKGRREEGSQETKKQGEERRV